MGFLSEGSLCGAALLELVARGSAIIAELLRLAEHVPGALLPGADPLQAKYLAVLFDFRCAPCACVTRALDPRITRRPRPLCPKQHMENELIWWFLRRPVAVGSGGSRCALLSTEWDTRRTHTGTLPPALFPATNQFITQYI